MVDKDGRYSYSSVQKFTPACAGSVQVYPNPANTFATVTGLSINMQVSLIDAQGKLLLTKQATGSVMQLPLSKFPNGLYLIQIKDANGKISSSMKLIKN